MIDRSEIHLDRLGVQNVHVTGYQYDEIRGVRYQEHRGHQVQQLPHDLWQLRLSVWQFLLAMPLHIQLDYQLVIVRVVEVRSQP